MSKQFRSCGGGSIYRPSRENCNFSRNLQDQKNQVDSILEYMSQGLQNISKNIQGVQGADGSGAQGIQGTEGLQGVQGVQGVQGADGSGAQGIQGTEGLQGVQGIEGFGSQGIQGVQGSHGTEGLGIQGIQGIQGIGNLGIQGIQGIQGTSGTSTRIDTSYTTEVLAQNAVADFTMNLGRMSDLISIQVSEPSWVRIYRSSAQRQADTRSSPGGTLQTVINLGDNKPYSENVTVSPSETIIQNPVPLLQGDVNGLVYVRLIKRSTGSGVVTLTTTTNTQEI